MILGNRHFAVLLLLVLSTSACLRVAPYQREALASRAMNPEEDFGEAKLDSHVEEYREGSIGGSGVGGGGCGCN